MGLAVAVAMLTLVANAIAQDYDNVQYTSVRAAENIHMLQGAGGNIGVFLGPDGVFLIDDQFAPLHEKLIAKIQELAAGTDADLARTFLINTHYHRDHTGGNELMGKAGAVIVAHENVRQRLTGEQVIEFLDARTPAMAPEGLPVITFSSDITFHLNGDSIAVIHVEYAHTDGDVIVQFTKANVIHAGDIVFTESYPFVDQENGGSVAGLIEAVETIIDLADDQTAIISGHGTLTDRAGLEQYHEMLSTIYERVARLVDEGKSLDEIQAAKPYVEFDSERSGGFISGDAFVGFIYQELGEMSE
jgi:glyoxylase-like metal-dependent hydrolase (beta-lactamase superfamily II)